jgi:hypothetical protein
MLRDCIASRCGIVKLFGSVVVACVASGRDVIFVVVVKKQDEYIQDTLTRLYLHAPPSPTHPILAHNTPNTYFARSQISHLEALRLDLLVLSTLLPNAHLLLRSVPLYYHTDVVRLAYIGAVLGMHRTSFALELGVAKADNVPGADLIVRLR